MRNLPPVVIQPRHEHSVPWFWPLAAAIELGEDGMTLFQKNLRYMATAAEIISPPVLEWTTSNRILLDLDTMLLRDFSAAGEPPNQTPILIDAPYAGHSSTIADFNHGQSLVEVLMANGLKHVLVTDWKSATTAMKDFDIDKYLTDINTAVEHLGGKVDLIGLCQGGWMSTMYAARFPDKVRSLVLAGSPIDTDAGNGPIKKLAQVWEDRYPSIVGLENHLYHNGTRIIKIFLHLSEEEQRSAFSRASTNPKETGNSVRPTWKNGNSGRSTCRPMRPASVQPVPRLRLGMWYPPTTRKMPG